MGVLAAFLILICVILFISILCIYAKYLQQKSKAHEKLVNGARLSLNPLPGSRGPGIRLTDNQIYEFCGETCTIRDLQEIPRDKVQLVKPLGCGAFGDVYQGLLRKRDTDSVDLAVAVKILPALSSNQAEEDFLMEALIMSKFNHPNIVHFIGACFDTHPRYIILELLAGGDLKNFLRENRPKVGKPSGLTIKDLLQCAMDVAKGCLYLEELRFIHRDIAARNCLLTSRGPGRVVKIADFGMSRDIYRSDYYKKEGKAMLPIKWMPPEAFLDGIFSTKTDVWSFGVLLWEVMSLGFMPYTGLRNREVMMSVARGARLGAPSKNCPPPVFAIMSMCWSHDPEQRPSFSIIVERLGYCMQDPSVINALLPVYTGPLPSEIDKTLMRSSNYEEDSIQTDYMIPRLPDSLFEWKNGNPDMSHKFAGEETPTFSSPLEGYKMIFNCENSDKNNGTLCNKGTGIAVPPDKANKKRMMNDVNCSGIHGKNEVIPKRPFTVSGQYVKDPRILRSSLSVD